MELVLNNDNSSGPTLCLNMIVKNESRIITRLFNSVLPIIDCYCICDTGSTDNTVDIITKYFIHRLIAITYIPNPDNKPNIDHINRNKLDNSIENLRWVTQAENRHNSTINRNNTSGYSNITIDKSRNSYVFYIRRNDYRFSKYFKTLEEAVAYRDDYLSKE